MKNIGKILLVGALLLPLLFIFSPGAQATTLYFNFSNEFGAWSGATPPGYGSVDITQQSDGIYFNVAANSNYFTPAANLTWDKFYFNFNPNKSLNTADLQVQETGTWTSVTNKNVSEFGVFAFGTVGTGNLGSSNDPLQFRIEDPSLTVNDFLYPSSKGWLFAGHLRRFSLDNVSSTFLAVGGSPAPVPEPGTLLLLGSGLLGLALLRKKWAQD